MKYTISELKISTVEETRYDLEERLLEFSVRIIRLSESLAPTRAGSHIAGQLLRSGTAPLPMHGEAQAAESARDFQHKLSVALKELRETLRWLKLAPLLAECDEWIRIFVASLRTSESRSRTQ